MLETVGDILARRLFPPSSLILWVPEVCGHSETQANGRVPAENVFVWVGQEIWARSWPSSGPRANEVRRFRSKWIPIPTGIVKRCLPRAPILHLAALLTTLFLP